MGLNKILYDINLEKARLATLRDAERLAKAAQESKKLAKVSRYLATAWELLSLWAKLEPGQSLVLDYDGTVKRGRVKTDKCQTLPEKLPERTPHAVDSNGVRMDAITRSWVNAPSAIFKSSWDTAIRKHRPQDDDPGGIVFEGFLEKLEQVMMADPECKALRMETTQTREGFTVHEIFIKDFPYSVAITKDGKFLYYRPPGEEPIW